MEKLRLSTHSERGADGIPFNPNHNDRSSNSSSDHIDSTKTPLNKTWIVYPDENLTFGMAEQKYYEEEFEDYINNRNEKVKDKSKKNKLTAEKYRKSIRTCPEETIFQIGNSKDGTVEPELLYKIWKKQQKWEEETFPNVIYLDVALHCDEATPHIHARKVYIYIDENGNKCVGQGKALEQMGIERPYPDKSKNRYNSEKLTYMKKIREHAITVCKEFGIEIEKEPIKSSVGHLTAIEYKTLHKEEELIKAEDELSKVTSETEIKKEELSKVTSETEIKKAELSKATSETEIKKEELKKTQKKNECLKNDNDIKSGMFSDCIDKYLGVRKKFSLGKDKFVMDLERFKQFEIDKNTMAENARVILEAENIEEKMAECKKIEDKCSEAKTMYNYYQRKIPGKKFELDNLEAEITDKRNHIEIQNENKALKSRIKTVNEKNNNLVKKYNEIGNMMTAVSKKAGDLIAKYKEMKIPQDIRTYLEQVKGLYNMREKSKNSPEHDEQEL